MAHLRSIILKCDSYGCNSRATRELYNIRNSPLGRYCGKHARQELKQQKKREQESCPVDGYPRNHG